MHYGRRYIGQVAIPAAGSSKQKTALLENRTAFVAGVNCF
jgi:hypothetical protein